MIPFDGFRIIEDINMVDYREDWSQVRSPSRALRRRKRGHRQRIVIRSVPRKDVFVIGNHTMVMHPTVAAELWRMTKAAQS